MYLLVLSQTELDRCPKDVIRTAVPIGTFQDDRETVMGLLRDALERLDSNPTAKAKAAEGLLGAVRGKE